MFFASTPPSFPKIIAPTADIVAKSKPSPEGKALLKPEMTPAQYQASLEKKKLSVDSVHFLAHGLPERDALCWACKACGLVMGKLSGPELEAFKLAGAWVKAPSLDLHVSLNACLGKVDFRGPGSWACQGALWAGIPGMPAVALAVIGAILLAAGLRIGPAMPPIPMPKLQVPMLPLPPEMMLQLLKPKLPALTLPVLDQPKLMKLLFPFIDLGKGVALGTLTCY
jgi:hypothetical protein